MDLFIDMAFRFDGLSQGEYLLFFWYLKYQWHFQKYQDKWSFICMEKMFNWQKMTPAGFALIESVIDKRI